MYIMCIYTVYVYVYPFFRFLATGAIVRNVCKAICERMQGIYMPEPSTKTWMESGQGY
jgi:hypothetical protein